MTITKKYFIATITGANSNNVKQFGSKQLFRVSLNGYVYLYSYRTIVGVVINNTLYLTSEKFSVTTSKQVTFLKNYYRMIYPIEVVPHSEFNELLKLAKV